MPACPKPERGSAAIARIKAKAKVSRKIAAVRQAVQRLPGPTAQRRAVKASLIVDAERLVKMHVKSLDGWRCRWPGCDHEIMLEAAHWKAEGMGGDPTLQRCTLENLICCCHWHHQQMHLGLASMRPVDEALGMRGPVEFSEAIPGKSGRMAIVGITKPPQEIER
jgi:hypothetical protein